jgi:RHS repeat-associated protein
MDRQTIMTFHDGSTRTSVYNEANDVVTYTDENGSVFTNTFDPLGRKTAVSIALASGVAGTTAQSFQFDGLSRITFARDSVRGTNADVTTVYDSLSRLLEESQVYGGNTRNVTNTAFVSLPATGFEFPNNRLLANTSDLLYRRTLVQDLTNSVNVAAWQFFGPSRVAEVTLGNGLICSWMNNARTHSAVQPSVANPGWGNQSSDRLGYDGAGRAITKRYLAGGIDPTTHGYINTSALVGFTTEYDFSSNKFYEREVRCEERSHLYEPFSNGSPTGGYDSINRLRQYQRGTLTSNDGFEGNGGGSISTPITLPNTDMQRTYDLDSLGNWRRTVFTPEGGSPETEIRQHNGLNEITRIQNGTSQTNLTYDGAPGHSNGNLANDGTRSYQWDSLNRLLQVNRVSDGAIIGQYVYDALNRRIRKTVSNGGLSGTIPNGTTDCVYSGWRCVEERSPFGGSGSTDTPTIQYIWGIYLDECLQQRVLVATNNFAANSDLYPLQDLLYRTNGLADSSGSVREAYDTDAYGNTLIFRNAGSPPGAIAWTDSDTQVNSPTCPFIFTGQRLDAECDLYYEKGRIYVPAIGGYASRDPVIDRGQCNFLVYCKNNPVRYVDPFGSSAGDFGDYEKMFEADAPYMERHLKNPKHKADFTYNPPVAAAHQLPTYITIHGEDSLPLDCTPSNPPRFLIGVVSTITTDRILSFVPMGPWEFVSLDPWDELKTSIAGKMYGKSDWRRQISARVEIHQRWDVFREYTCICGGNSSRPFKTFAYDTSAEVRTGSTHVASYELGSGTYVIRGSDFEAFAQPPSGEGALSGNFAPEPVSRPDIELVPIGGGGRGGKFQ